MKRDLHGRRILLTGASSGIGQTLAEQLAHRGARLVLAARSLEKLQAIAASLTNAGCDVTATATDVTSAGDRQHALDLAAKQLGGLDVLINNAGIGSFGHFAECTESILRQIMEVNFFAPAELIRLAIPLLKESPQAAIVNVASMCGRRGMPAWSEYSASKFALVGLGESLRAELAHCNIDVVVILPGLTRSDLGRHLLRNTGRMEIRFDQGMPPATVAAGIIRALVKRRPEAVLGSEARWMLRLNRWVPRILDYLIARKIKQLYAT